MWLRLAPLAAFALFTIQAIVFAAAADTFDAQTTSEVQRVVTQQLDAFANGDAEGAEELAAPGIREKFPSPSAFMAMVKSNYAALVRPKSTQFNELAATPSGPLQKMTIVAADGTVWTAAYLFQNVDGHWRISACGINQDKSQQDI